jgi:hypothetical protein
MEMILHLILSAGLEVKLSGGFRYFYIRLEHRKI